MECCVRVCRSSHGGGEHRPGSHDGAWEVAAASDVGRAWSPVGVGCQHDQPGRTLVHVVGLARRPYPDRVLHVVCEQSGPSVEDLRDAAHEGKRGRGARRSLMGATHSSQEPSELGREAVEERVANQGEHVAAQQPRRRLHVLAEQRAEAVGQHAGVEGRSEVTLRAPDVPTPPPGPRTSPIESVTARRRRRGPGKHSPGPPLSRACAGWRCAPARARECHKLARPVSRPSRSGATLT